MTKDKKKIILKDMVKQREYLSQSSFTAILRH